MLLNFTMENWMSFRDETIMSMVASDAPVLDRQLPYVKEHDLKILPTCAIYGGNSAGKSNLFKAFEFLKNYITLQSPGKNTIPVNQFLLDGKTSNGSTKFDISILASKNPYHYSFEVTRSRVLKENLQMEINGDIIPIYQRDHIGQEEEISFFGRFSTKETLCKARRTSSLELLLSNHALREINELKEVYKWFDESLLVFSPRNKLNFTCAIANDGKKFNESLATLLTYIGIDITRIGIEELDFDQLDISTDAKNDIVEKLNLNEKKQAIVSIDNVVYTLSSVKGNIMARRMFTERMDVDGGLIKFDLSQESEGTRHFINLSHLLFTLTRKKSNSVVFIDEIDSSLHVILTKAIVNFFLYSTNQKSRSQLLFTTHDTNLIDKDIFREDELLFIEQNSFGVSSMQYAVDFADSLTDNNLVESYLQGRMGGVPDVFPVSPSQVLQS